MKSIFIATLAFIFFGCKKTFNCECKQISVPEGNVAVHKIKAWKKETAEKECSDKTTYTTNHIPQSIDTQCMLK